MIPYKTAGEFLRMMRINRDISLTDMARRMGIVTPFMSDMERGCRKIPQKRLKQFVSVLNLKYHERVELYDLVAAERKEIPIDITEYLLKHPTVVDCIRSAINYGASKEDWFDFVREIEKSV